MANTLETICVVDDTTVAGTRFIPEMKAIASAYGEDEVFSFEREADNPHDPWAVRVKDAGGHFIGYVSCECNEVVSRLIAGGRRLTGALRSVEQIGSWTRVTMGVMLHD